MENKLKVQTSMGTVTCIVILTIILVNFKLTVIWNTREIGIISEKMDVHSLVRIPSTVKKSFSVRTANKLKVLMVIHSVICTDSMTLIQAIS